MGKRMKNDSQIRELVSNISYLYNNKQNLRRVTDAGTHEIGEKYAIKTEIKKRALFLLGELK